MPKVSVLMPVYNSEKYISYAIESILRQTFRDWELIIVNDGSTDAGENIIMSYSDNRIKYFKNSNNEGIIYTRNFLLKQATGEYIAFLDSDDIALPQRLLQQTKFLDRNPGYILCGTWGIIINSKGEKIKNIHLASSCEEIKCDLLFSNTFIQSSIMCRKKLFEEFSYNPAFPVVEDYELWSRVINTYKVKNLTQHLIKYRWHETNISQERKELMEEMTQKVYENQLSALGIHPGKFELDLHSSIRSKRNTGLPEKEYFTALKKWINKLSKANENTSRYNPGTFTAILYFRWIFACKGKGSYRRMLSFPVKLNFHAFLKLVYLLYMRIK